MTLYGELLKRQQEGNPIRVGVIGAGQMGRGMIAQIATIPGMIVTGVSDLFVENAEKAKEAYLASSEEKMICWYRRILRRLFTLT